MNVKRGPKPDPKKIEFYRKRLVDEGRTISEIARELGVSKEAVSVFAGKHFEKKIIWKVRE